LRARAIIRRDVPGRVRGGRRELVERGRLGQQALAQAFERMLARRVEVMAVCPGVEPAADRHGVDVAHHFADVLELALARAPRSDRPRRHDGVDQPVRQPGVGGQLPEPPCVERDQRFARSCSSCIAALRRVLDGGRPGSAGAVRSAPVARMRRCRLSSGRSFGWRLGERGKRVCYHS